MKIKVLKAIAEETRLEILEKLKKREVCACALPAMVKKTQPAVSQHLKILFEAGLVRKRKEGIKRIYSLSTKGLRVLRDILKW